ncbi:hypothetical protein BLS_007461 [Venturia inaequalis]|uniref:C2H2-type domain-containing protein n=1 Tax=Venturia inaequalis TaxID=5025 RepID=A0A8H3U9V0_VENIN|nr:hypothetical protein BLS_007461 [Venturia inaequalis]
MVFEPSATTPTTLKTMNATAIDERTDTMNGNRIKEPRPATATCYSCNMCRISYLNVREQRVHMKELWHVNNIKRRIDSLPPISRDEFDAPLATRGQSTSSRTSATIKKKRIIISERSSSDIIQNDANSDEESGSSEDLDSQPSPSQCLFCKDSFDKEEDGLTQNLTHMRKAHDFRIPNADQTTGSASQKPPKKRRDARGALIPTTDETRNNDPPSINEGPESPHLITAPPSSSCQLSRREEMSLIGISPQQRQFLILGERKAQRAEAMARREREWVNAKNANKQEFDQLDNRGKHGKQNHKLLPR